MSETLKSAKDIDWLRKGAQIPLGTYTSSMHQSRRCRHDSTVNEVNISDWFGGNRSLTVREEVVRLGSYGRVLTILTCPDFLDSDLMEEEDEFERSLEESWIPRFRR